MISLNYENINYVMNQILKLSCVRFSYGSISYVLAHQMHNDQKRRVISVLRSFTRPQADGKFKNVSNFTSDVARTVLWNVPVKSKIRLTFLHKPQTKNSESMGKVIKSKSFLIKSWSGLFLRNRIRNLSLFGLVFL